MFSRMQNTPISKYEILESIGEGATSKVYKAQNREDKSQIVALKVIKLGGDITYQSIEKEIRVLEKLSKYPNCNPYVVCYITNYFDKQLNIMDIVTEYIAGPDFDVLTFSQDIPNKTWIKLYLDIANGLMYLHSKKIVHRDIKLVNLLFDENTQKGKLIDLGFTCEFKESLKGVGAGAPCTGMPGTIKFAAPELFDEVIKSLNRWKAADVYSLGYCMFMSFNRTKEPYSAQKTQNLVSEKQHYIAHKSNSGIPEIDNLIAQMLSLDPAKRPSIKNVVNVLSGKPFVTKQKRVSAPTKILEEEDWTKRILAVISPEDLEIFSPQEAVESVLTTTFKGFMVPRRAVNEAIDQLNRR